LFWLEAQPVPRGMLSLSSLSGNKRSPTTKPKYRSSARSSYHVCGRESGHYGFVSHKLIRCNSNTLRVVGHLLIAKRLSYFASTNENESSWTLCCLRLTAVPPRSAAARTYRSQPRSADASRMRNNSSQGVRGRYQTAEVDACTRTREAGLVA
jgi:hypothetical protein